MKRSHSRDAARQKIKRGSFLADRGGVWIIYDDLAFGHGLS
jgi:hypothetical protein